jgi:hypothetical protein
MFRQRLAIMVWRYVFVSVFEALFCQVATTFDSGCAARIRIEPAFDDAAEGLPPFLLSVRCQI